MKEFIHLIVGCKNNRYTICYTRQIVTSKLVQVCIHCFKRMYEFKYIAKLLIIHIYDICTASEYGNDQLQVLNLQKKKCNNRKF